MFVNFSNHISDNWSKEQIEAASVYGEIVDVEFPILNPEMTEEDIVRIGDEYIEKIASYNPDAVMCQGEFTLIFYVVNGLLKKGITCLAACTNRVTVENILEDGTVKKESEFRFVGFRKYVQ